MHDGMQYYQIQGQGQEPLKVLVFVSHDFEVGRNVTCEESTVSPVWG